MRNLVTNSRPGPTADGYQWSLTPELPGSTPTIVDGRVHAAVATEEFQVWFYAGTFPVYDSTHVYAEASIGSSLSTVEYDRVYPQIVCLDQYGATLDILGSTAVRVDADQRVIATGSVPASTVTVAVWFGIYSDDYTGYGPAEAWLSRVAFDRADSPFSDRDYLDGTELWGRWTGVEHASTSEQRTVGLRYYHYLGYGGPLAGQDVANDYAAGKEAAAACAPLELAGAIAANPAVWSDPTAAPDELIANMAMRRGLRGRHGQSIQRLRERLENPPAAEDGSSEAIAEAVRGVLLVPGAYVSVTSNYHPIDGPTDGHTTVTVNPDDAAGVSLDQIQVAGEQGAPGWIVIHAVIAEGETIDELVDDIDDYTGPINEL